MRIYFLLIILLCFVMPVSGVPSSSSVDYYNITTSEGLPANGIGAIKKDSLGFIWIGTNQGVCRFDGCEIKIYPVLQGDDIWSLEELDADTLLVGTGSCLKYLSRRSNTIVKLDIPSSIVKTIQRIDSRRFLVGTETGLYLVNNHVPHQILLETKFSPCNHITSIFCEDKNVYWFSTINGLGRIDLRTMETTIYRMQETLENTNHFTCLTRVSNQIYLGSFNKGVFRFDMSDKKFTKIAGFEHNLIMTIDGQDNQLFVGTNGHGLKVMSFSDGSIETFSYKEKMKNSLSSNTVISFLYDNGIQWVGTQFGGINYTPRDRAKFSYYNWKDFYSTDYRVRCCYIFPNGDKLISTRTALFFISEKRNILRRYSMDDRSSGMRSNGIFIDKVQEKVLIATYGGGVHVFDEKTLQLKDLSQEEPFLYGCFFHFTQDGQGNLWLASQDGLYKSTPDGHILKKYDMMNSQLTTNNVFYVYADKQNHLWIGTKNGLFLMDIDTEKIHTDCFGIPIKSLVKYIMLDSKKNLWICSFSGLYKLGQDFQVVEHFTTDNLLPDNRVSSIQEDNEGNYWIVMSKEIVKYIPKAKVHYTYRRLEGLNGEDFNNDVVMSADSILWWANEGGLIYTSEKEKKEERTMVTTPTITSYFVADVEYDFPYNLSQEVTLTKSDNNIRFKFSNLDYSLPYANVYEYKLEGYDTNWIKQTGVNEAIYKNLPSGRYYFRLRAPGTEGHEQQMTVIVSRSYTFLIVSSFVIVLITALVIYFCYRIWKLKKRMTNERLILSTVQEQGKVKKMTLPDSKISELLEELLSYMEHEKPYLNAKLSIGNIAAKLGCTEQELSQLLNSHMNVNYANFINVYRVKEIKSRLNQENLSRYTLNTLSEQCGFSSKTTFYRVFKDVTGMTPLEYCKKQNLVVERN